jgi:hypothetical protein
LLASRLVYTEDILVLHISWQMKNNSLSSFKEQMLGIDGEKKILEPKWI